jgi:4-amino-4-deoxy-L-arabinose transferase-like glycosyltransferase
MTEPAANGPAVIEKRTNPQARTGFLLLLAFCGFLFFYGLGAFGLLGADEPRYAQVAREMLNRSDWVTPTLQGKPWLEKPVLYYWQAMLSFRALGVSGAAARVPAAFDAALLAAAIYFFLKRFRPGTELDGTLITASCAGIIGFAHAAATDMPLAASFSVALLAWYGWYQSRQKIYLAAFYVFLALGTLAKGPVAPALSAVILFLFIAVKRDWRAVAGTLWITGIALYLVVMLPWYVAVQMRNPEFFRVFILEHNLARFSQDVYHHRQPFWFYLPVFLLATMPWTIVLVLAVAEYVRLMLSRRKESTIESTIDPEDPGKDPEDPRNSWPLFLLIWMLVPILFFSISQSKLPGYILPAVPAGALLVTQYLSTCRRAGVKFSMWFAAAQGMLCGVLIFVALSAASIVAYHRLQRGTGTYLAAAVAAAFALGIAIALRSRSGLRLLTRVTALAVVIGVGAVIRLSAPVVDANQSARPIAERIQAVSHQAVPLAIYRINRLQQYGLEFYLNRAAQSYESGNIPADPHVVVAAQGTETQVAQLVPGRRVSYVTGFPEQKLDVYWVGK